MIVIYKTLTEENFVANIYNTDIPHMASQSRLSLN